VAQQSLAVVGAGLVGLASARGLMERFPRARVTVLEKEAEVGAHQSSHNSGVVHAGVYYRPGSQKARLCAEGRELLARFCEAEGVDYLERGKLVVATTSAQLATLRAVAARARTNSVPGASWLGPQAARRLEPHVKAVAALHSPRTAVVDYPGVARALARQVEVRLGFEVARIDCTGPQVVLRSQHGEELVAHGVVICAGLQSDLLATLAGDSPEPEIVPFLGEYWRLAPGREGLVNGLVYPVPDLRYPFLGVHFTKRVDGSVEVGPNALLALSREGYRRWAIERSQVRRLASSPAVRAMARRHWRAGLAEGLGALSKSVYLARARALIPDLCPEDLVRGPVGVRAQAVDKSGTLVDDFVVHRVGGSGRVVAVRNAPSPAATAALAIGRQVAQLL